MPASLLLADVFYEPFNRLFRVTVRVW